MTTPDPRRIRAAQRRLRRHQGAFIPKPRLPIIDEAVATVLSQRGRHLRRAACLAVTHPGRMRRATKDAAIIAIQQVL
jgi:hypothetical protein